MKESLQPNETLSHYVIIERLGSGGMGEVYLAEDTMLDRQVAIKVLLKHSTADEQAKKRLLREARAAAKLDHPNICAIHEVAETDGLTFIVMQYLQGETLAAKLNGKPMGVTASLDLAVQLADALSEAHLHGIIHRDIKPENTMVGERGQVKLMDFGLARVIQSPTEHLESETVSLLTQPGMIIGTVPYMSPEQLRGESLDARTDIFSLGAMLYEMLSGNRPFAAGSPAATISSILTQTPPPLTDHSPEVPAEMQRIVTKCLEKDRKDRYQSSRDLWIDLRNLKQETESGRVISAVFPPRRGMPHYKVFAALTLLILTLASFAIFKLISGGNPIDSVAVLPFVNANADPNTDYLADGIPETIISSLSQLPKLKVTSRNSAFRYKGTEIDAQTVGKELKVQAVLTGRVVPRNDGLLISVELIDAHDNSQIWGQQYNRKLSDVFAVQEEMAKEISEKLRLKLTGAERQQLTRRPTENLKAFEYYVQGRAYAYRRTREDLLTAIRYCEKAIEEDHNYAIAYAGLADAYSNLGVRGYIAPREARQKEDESARKALELDESLAEAHAAQGQVYLLFAPCNFSLGDRELRRAIELSPSLAVAHQYLGNSLARQGRLDEGLEELLKARELDPLSPTIARLVATSYYLKRDYARALTLLRDANQLGPTFTNSLEIGIYVQGRLLDEALEELDRAEQERKGDSLLIYGRGVVYATQGKRAEALEIISKLEEMSGDNLSNAHWIAKIYASLNERELAFKWLEHGLAAGTIGSFIKDDPMWDTIRGDPRFPDLLRRMGIPS